jgi:hypothetical protein
MDSIKFRWMPTIAFSRSFYALRFLLQLSYHIWMTQSQQILPLDTLRVDFYIDALTQSLESAAGINKNRAPQLWLYALQTRIIPWHNTLRQHASCSISDQSYELLDFGPIDIFPLDQSQFKDGLNLNTFVENGKTDNRSYSPDVVDMGAVPLACLESDRSSRSISHLLASLGL